MDANDHQQLKTRALSATNLQQLQLFTNIYKELNNDCDVMEKKMGYVTAMAEEINNTNSEIKAEFERFKTSEKLSKDQMQSDLFRAVQFLKDQQGQTSKLELEREGFEKKIKQL